MTREQAEACLRAIYATYGKQQQPTIQQAEAIMSYLRQESYEITMQAIEVAVKTSNYPPNISAIERAKAQIAESHRYDTPTPTPYSSYDVWRMDQIIGMTDEEYWQYLDDRRHGNLRQEAYWQHDWREMNAVGAGVAR